MTGERLWGWRHAFDSPITLWFTVAILSALVLAAAVIAILSWSRVIEGPLRRELWMRTVSWFGIVLAVVVPILLGALWTIVVFCVLGLLCYSEYARATGLFRAPSISACVVLGIVVINFAVVDHWYGLFFALFPLTVGVIAVVSIPADRPQGYIQRVALGVFAFLLFGGALSHLGYMANDWNYRPIVLMLLMAVAVNDIAAYVVGKSLGGPKLLPNTSPNKTISGAVGALLVTTGFVAIVAGPVFQGTPMAEPWHRLGLGLIVSIAGQLGDLMLSSIKRDIGIKDTGAVIPGHGGILDRANSLLLVAPSAFHYIGYFVGFGLDQQTRIIAWS
ncbi:MAG TPA: phosphatidate cytidylyltransferase [Alphaproteobacteria bacterium]|nr:phosphatidate cytidylyltransferase [Alphaproteobacteria bacterium]